ncbi:FAD binding domain-containing protein [uncultured Erythrobacter sp.]|uniref:FAD binding domain-containing protein n=1 Tax=uncultured Erythrobacter sp. TaxID=263913 RepID=UPI00262DFDA8|nr:FAD binding domain-containing protein [uncultured Erythrobacter sp.]
MIPASFDYVAPSSPREAIRLLESDKDAVLLAGGHSLLTALKQRTKRASRVIDIAQIGLGEVSITVDGDLKIEAAVTQTALAEYCAKVGWTILAEVGEKAGDPMIRERGTFVGALCAAEPGGDWAAAALALDAQLHIYTSSGEYHLPYAEYLEDGLAESHMVLGALVPAQHRKARQGYVKVKHAGIGWSVASVGFVECGEGIQLGAGGALSKPARLRSVEDQFAKIAATDDRLASIFSALEGLEFHGDRYAPAVWRRKRLAILLRDITQAHSFKEPA